MLEFLIAGMLAWMTSNCAVVDEIHPKHSPCQYNYNVTHPKVVFLSQKNLRYEFYSRGSSAVGSNENVDLYGFYRRKEKTIFLESTWDKDNIYDQGTLFHELYHHVQFENHSDVSCISHREIPTALFQKRFINSFGVDEDMYLYLYDAPCNVYYKEL
tara:strand:- start:234 stop:704 length:471 start_codon:yes stop_codon:yes gene_type:complete